MTLPFIFDKEDSSLYEVRTSAKGPTGTLPLTAQMLEDSPSGDLFGLSQNVGMGWKPKDLLGTEVLILGTKGGIRDHNGEPIALGYHTGHWEVDILMAEAAEEIREHKGVPFAGFVSDPCDGRSQGTLGMFDSFPYRNDAAIVYRRLIRSLPTREAVIGVATCDKGLPAMMIALSSMHDLPTIIVPGGVTLPPTIGEDAGKIQTIGARFANKEITLKEAAELGCVACATPGGGCQFLGTAATSQVVAEALGIAITHSALAPSGQKIWAEMARQSARAVLEMERNHITTKDIITDKAIENAMVVHAAFGGSTNLLLHIPALAHAAKCHIPTVDDWARINRKTPRLVSVLPNGPDHHPTVRVFLAGGVPEVMLHLRKLGLLHEDVLTVTGHTLGENLDWWEKSERRALLRKRLLEADGVNPDQVIMDPVTAKARGLTPTITFPKGNIAPEGSVIKSTSIDRSVVGEDGIYRHTGVAKVFTSEKSAITAIKTGGIEAGDVMVVMGGGPSGTGMEETYQLTSALKYLPFGKYVSLITDARFSGVSTGACIGHIGPEALSDGPIGKLRNGDLIEIIVDCEKLIGSVDFVGTKDQRLSKEEATSVLEAREAHPDLKPDPNLPDDTRLWAALQAVSGGTWRGSVYDVDRIIEVLEAGKKALAKEEDSFSR
jgi:xylonate dehydratase